LTFSELGIEERPGVRIYYTTCPVCSHTRTKKTDPCLTVCTEEGNRWYKCHNDSCDFQGNLEVHDKYKEVKEKSRMPSSQDALKAYSRDVSAYFNKRGITTATLLKEKVYEPSGKNSLVGFPFYISLTLVNVKFLNLSPAKGKPKWFQLPKTAGTKLCFMGLQNLNINMKSDRKKKNYLIITEGECFTGDAEILTRSGWVAFKDYQGQDVMQTKGLIFEGSFVQPKAFIKKEYNGKLVELKSKNYYSLTTPNHDIVTKTYSPLCVKKRKAIEIYNSKALNDSIPTVINKMDGNKGIQMSDEQIKFCIAVSADMTIRKIGSIYGCFKKLRKKERLEEIMRSLQLRYSINIESRGFFSIFIHQNQGLDYVFKKFPQEWIGLMTNEQAKLIISEILFWDGNSVPNRNQIEYSSKDYDNATFIQTIAHLTGKTSTIIRRENQYGKWFKVSILFDKKHVCTQRSLKRNLIDHNGLVYCVTVPYGNILVRQNEKISISGNCDMLTWKECGYVNVISVPQGAPATNAKDFSKEFEYVNDRFFQGLRPYIDMFYLSTDADEAGVVLRDQLALRLGKEKCRVIKYPPGTKDINDVLTRNKELTTDFDRDAVIDCFNNAGSYPIKGIIKPSDVRVELEVIAEGGLPPGLGIGVAEFDYLMTFKRKLTSYWTGIANMGKSTYVRWVLIKLVQNNPDLNLKFGLYTPENRPAVREFVMISQILTGKRFQRGFWNSMTEDQRRKSLNFIEKHFFLVAPGRRNYEDFGGKIKVHQASTLDGITEYFAYLAKTEGIFGYLIDAWNKVQHEVPKGMSDTNYIEQSLDRLLEFNDYYDCHGAIIAHPTKLELNKRTGKYEIPSMYDIKGSSAWYDRADYGVVIHRNIWRALTDQEKMDQDEEDDRTYVTRHNAPTIVKTEKIRFEETGNKDMVRFDKDSTGGFKVFSKDKGVHVERYKKQKEREDDQRMEEEAKAQQTIPAFINVPDEDDSPLPF